MVAELAASAVLHGQVPGRDFALRLAYNTAKNLVRIEVTDTHNAMPARAPRGAAGEERGRGLVLVDAIALRWGVSGRSGPGKTVWAYVPASREEPEALPYKASTYLPLLGVLMSDTRARILGEAMRLFGELGYTATTIAKIEEAAGLSPGSGALYKHFRSKKDILSVGLRERIRKKDALTTLLGTEAPAPAAPPATLTTSRALLRAVAKSGLERLAYERDVNRILVQDLAAFPELLEEFRTAEVARNHAALTQLLQTHSTPNSPQPDWSAVAAILQDALSHYWLMADIFGGTHPTGVTEDAYLDTLTDLALGLAGVPASAAS